MSRGLLFKCYIDFLQVTDIPDSPQLDPALAPALAAAAAAAAVGLPTNASPTHGQSEYNELLYAHLLDADGNRLTYTHFTAKVVWNSMIDITFNRSVYVKANKVNIGYTVQPADIGWPTGNGKKLSNSQACCLAQLCLGAA